MSTQQPGDNSGSADNQPESHALDTATGRLTSGPLTGIVLGLAGGFFAWAVIQNYSPFFAVPEAVYAEVKGPPSEEKQAEIQAIARESATLDAMCTVGMLGAMIGALLAIGESRRDHGPLALGWLDQCPAGADHNRHRRQTAASQDSRASQRRGRRLKYHQQFLRCSQANAVTDSSTLRSVWRHGACCWPFGSWSDAPRVESW